MPQEGRIGTQAQLEAARATRRELTSQLEGVTARRGTLVQQRHNADATGNTKVVAEYDAQIVELGARMSRLERQKAQMDDAIVDAVRRGVGQEVQETPPPGSPWTIQPTPPVPPTPSETFTLFPPPPPELSWLQLNAERLLVFESLAFVLVGVAIWRVARRRGRSAPEVQAGVDQMRQAVDAIAVEVERISENQRYVTKLLAERLGEGAAHEIETKVRERSTT